MEFKISKQCKAKWGKNNIKGFKTSFYYKLKKKIKIINMKFNKLLKQQNAFLDERRWFLFKHKA